MAQKKIIWSSIASKKLVSILDSYNTRNGNTTYSEKLLREIDTIISFLPDHPHLGKPTNKEPYRIVIRGNYEVMYRIENDDIIIVALWDSRQNPIDKTI